MEQASIPLYIRFGEIPEDKISRVHRGDAIIREEGGLSVWRAITDGMGKYYPMLPSDANDDAISDYFYQLLEGDQRVYLVTGNEIGIEGADREPLITDPVILKEITHYIHPKFDKKMKRKDENRKVYVAKEETSDET